MWRGLAIAKILGHPKVLTEPQRSQAIQQLEESKPIASIARSFNTSRQTIMRARDTI